MIAAVLVELVDLAGRVQRDERDTVRPPLVHPGDYGTFTVTDFLRLGSARSCPFSL